MSLRAVNPYPVDTRRRVSAGVLGLSRTLAGLLASAVLVLGCDRRAPYSIGVVLDDDGARGAMLAAAVVNARGGVNGHLVELRITEVDTSSARGALEAAERLASDEGVLAVIAASRESGIGVVYASSFAEDNRFAGRDDLAAALANTHPDLLVWIGRDQQFDLILGALKQRLPRLVVLASDAFDGDVLARDTLNRFAGIRLVRFTDRHRADSVLSTLQKRYGALGGGNMNDQALLSYDAVELLAEAMRHAGPNRAAIREWLSRVGKTAPPFNGVSGAIAFRNGGDQQPAYFVEHIGTPVQSRTATAEQRTWTPE